MNYQKTFDTVNRDIDIIFPILQQRSKEALDECHHLGYQVEIFEGYRSPFRQNKLYVQSKTKGPWVTNADAWQSLHQYGLAIDLAFKIKGKWSWDGSHPWDKVASIMQSHGLEWPKPKGEMAHFQIDGGLKISEIRSIADEQGIPGLWLIMKDLV